MIRAYLAFADILESSLGNASGAAHFRAYAAAGAAFVRAQLGATWFAPGVLGVHAAAEALNTPGFASADEAAALVASTLNNQATICSQSNFNSYWILQGLGNGGVLDRAVAMIERCWGSAIDLGATCFFEVNTPEWKLFMRPGPSVAPWGYNGEHFLPLSPSFSPYTHAPFFAIAASSGNTSLAHPWSAGAAPWLTKNVLGLSPMRPGFAAVLVAPHLTPALAAAPGGLSGSVPTPHGAVSLHASRARGIELSVPAGCVGGALLRLSEVLLLRLGWLDLDLGGGDVLGLERGLTVLVNGVATTLRAASTGEQGPRFESELSGLRNGGRSRVALLALPPGEHVIVASSAQLLPARSLAGVPPPFPPLEWPARIVQLDTQTQGSWVSKYGSEGYVLWGADVSKLPPYVSTFGTMDAWDRQWRAPAPGVDARALQDPHNESAPRAIGYLESGINELPQYTFGIDIALTPEAEAAGAWYQVALCACRQRASSCAQRVCTVHERSAARRQALPLTLFFPLPRVLQTLWTMTSGTRPTQAPLTRAA